MKPMMYSPVPSMKIMTAIGSRLRIIRFLAFWLRSVQKARTAPPASRSQLKAVW